MLVVTYFLGIINIVTSVHEGFYNVPKLYGSEVREQGKITDFGSGMKEAGKARRTRICGFQSWLIDIAGFHLRLLRWYNWPSS
jgi:hypothetical protein